MNTGESDSGEGYDTGSNEIRVRDYTYADDSPEQIPGEAWQISARLLTTLDAERMVELFTRELSSEFGYDSFEYRHDEMGIVFSDGAQAQHKLAYRLTLGGRLLGEMMVTRRKRFTHDEVRHIENRLCGLVYALRNAMLYREAVESAFNPLTPDAGMFQDGVRSAA